MTPIQRMATLAMSFPTLRKAPGLDPWDPATLDGWAAGPGTSSGARHAARFVLAVWNETASWRSGPFNIIEAIQSWDAEHRKAFQAWTERPYLP